MDIVIMSFFQFLLVFLKHLNIRVIVTEQSYKSMSLTLLIQLSWLISSALGINAFLQSDWLAVAAYLASGVLGNFMSLKIKV